MYVERIKDLKVVDIDRSVYKYKPSVVEQLNFTPHIALNFLDVNNLIDS